jgi:hypothetical protein
MSTTPQTCSLMTVSGVIFPGQRAKKFFPLALRIEGFLSSVEYPID